MATGRGTGTHRHGNGHRHRSSAISVRQAKLRMEWFIDVCTEWSTCAHVVDDVTAGKFTCSHIWTAHEPDVSDSNRSEADI